MHAIRQLTPLGRLSKIRVKRSWKSETGDDRLSRNLFLVLLIQTAHTDSNKIKIDV